MTLTFTTDKSLFKFNVAKEVISNMVKRVNKEPLIHAIVDIGDYVKFKGELVQIANPSVKGHTVLYLTAENKTKIGRTVCPICSSYTVVMQSAPYRGESDLYRPYRPGLEVLGTIRDNKFIIKEIKHRKYGLTSS